MGVGSTPVCLLVGWSVTFLHRVRGVAESGVGLGGEGARMRFLVSLLMLFCCLVLLMLFLGGGGGEHSRG